VGLLVELERVLGGELVVLLDSGSVAVHPTRSSAVMSSSDFLIRTPLRELGRTTPLPGSALREFLGDWQHRESGRDCPRTPRPRGRQDL
jgi:hypothetical protein